MFNQHDTLRNGYCLNGSLQRRGYDWWWHSFTARNTRTNEEVPFFVEFFVINPKLAKDEPTLGQAKENKEKHIRPSYLMVKCGAWTKGHKVQLHRFFSLKDVAIKRGRDFAISAKDCFASETQIMGRVDVSEDMVKQHPEMMCDAGSMVFNLTINKQITFNVGYGANTFFRAIKAFQMYWHAEGMKSEYEGTVVLNGETYKVSKDNCYGYADKNWGRGFTSPWVWLASSNLKSNIDGKQLLNSAFDIGGGRPKIYFIPLNRKLLGCFYYEGEEIDLNFAKFWTKPKQRFSFKEDDEKVYWHVEMENKDYLFIVEVNCKKEDMLLVNYEDPDGNKFHNRLFNGGNGIGNIKLYKKIKKNNVLIDDISVTHIGCEYGEYDK